MTDWIAAGQKADAHRVRNVMRRGYSGRGKALARGRVIEAFRAAGVSVVLDFWGGGLSAAELIAAGFQVVCVENGTQVVKIGGKAVSVERKRHAFMRDADETGFVPFWGNAVDALAAHPEINGAFLDFCGPWTDGARATVHATRGLIAIVVTLLPDRDMSTGAVNIQERQLAYQLFLKMARAKVPRWGYMRSSGCRILTDYDGGHGQRITVYYLGVPVKLAVVTVDERAKMRGDVHKRLCARYRAYYHRLDDASKAARKARTRHNAHLRTGSLPFKPCQMCGASRVPLACSVCDAAVISCGQARYCSDICRRQKKMADQRLRRVAAVFGTAAEAV